MAPPQLDDVGDLLAEHSLEDGEGCFTGPYEVWSNLFSQAVLLENACFLEGDRTCVQAVHRRVWVAFGLGGVFVVIMGLVVVSAVRRAWRRRRR
jgi:hypothetical protein